MPIHEELKEAKLNGLTMAITKHGGYPAVAQKLGLAMAYQRTKRGFWNERANLDRALHNYIKESGSPGKMPTVMELEGAGRMDLIVAIAKHGGFRAVAEGLNLSQDG
jgi:hypothetical protein